MITCPNCAWQNAAGSRFCENCGADLQALGRSTPTAASSWPEPPRRTPGLGIGEIDPASPEWRMAPLPHEEPPKQKRRVWVWLVVFALLGCLVFCLLSFGWLTYTDSGHSFQTRISDEQTIQAGK